jgi:hypothetical protein
MNHEKNVDELLSASWHQLLARDLVSEVEYFSGDKRCLIPELRTLFAIKGYRDLLLRPYVPLRSGGDSPSMRVRGLPG